MVVWTKGTIIIIGLESSVVEHFTSDSGVTVSNSSNSRFSHTFSIEFLFKFDCPSGGAVDKSVRPVSGRLGVRIPAAKDLSLRNR